MALCTCSVEFDPVGKDGYIKHFCSRSCANSRGKRTEEFKRVVSEKLKFKSSKVIQTIKPKKIFKITSVCLNCFKSFEHPIYRSRIYCCAVCRHTSSGGYREGSGRAKTGYYKGIYCGSTYELVWVIYQIDNSIPFKRFQGLLEKDGLRYYPDFIQNNTIIEIKGYEDQVSVDRKTEVAMSFGYSVKVLRKVDLQHCFDWVSERYTSKYASLYDGFKPRYTFACSACGLPFDTDNKNRKTCSASCAKIRSSGKGIKKIHP